METEYFTIIPKGEQYFASHTGDFATLTRYTPVKKADETTPAVIICPGGGYEFISCKEGGPVAQQFCLHGVQPFVLNYSVAPNRFPAALLELSEAVSLVRANAKAWHIKPNQIFLCGFSAGGHLVANFGTLKEMFGLPKVSGMLLCYPVITTGEYAHAKSFDALLGNGWPNKEVVSAELHVNAKTPPTFLWHTREDQTVPVENSLLFVTALQKNKLPYAAHFYQQGPHALALADETTADWDGEVVPCCQNWFAMALEWLHGCINNICVE